jgi:hypothetical protein
MFSLPHWPFSFHSRRIGGPLDLYQNLRHPLPLYFNFPKDEVLDIAVSLALSSLQFHHLFFSFYI